LIKNERKRIAGLNGLYTSHEFKKKKEKKEEKEGQVKEKVRYLMQRCSTMNTCSGALCNLGSGS